MRMKECEIQLSQSRYEEQRRRAETDARKARTLSEQVSTFSQTETELRSQLNIYVEKFKQVRSPQSYLIRSLSMRTLLRLCLGAI